MCTVDLAIINLLLSDGDDGDVMCVFAREKLAKASLTKPFTHSPLQLPASNGYHGAPHSFYCTIVTLLLDRDLPHKSAKAYE